MARALMFQGTGSDVGKTVLVAGLCRAALRRGITVLPFKPQNMSNNAAVADPGPDGLGGEIGRAQWLQALACAAAPSVHMNPVLLKPQSETGAQVVVHGKVAATAKARDYQKLKPQLMQAVLSSFDELSARCDLVLVEGAGSPAEINLRAGDIANMGFATHAGVPVILVGDIDRGGVIASLVGTHTILATDDRAMVAGFLINKFRGDMRLFDDGMAAISRFTGWPGFGMLPHLECARRLPAEDSVALEKLAAPASNRKTVVVPVMGRIANFDDIDPLMAEPDLQVVFLRTGDAFPADAAMVVLPGSKSTIADLNELVANGWAEPVRAFAGKGGLVIGICGGYQMLGRRIADPHGIEGNPGEVEGLGLLDIETVLEGEKIVRNASAQDADTGLALDGYEIHMGRTEGADCARPMVKLDGRPDGAVSAAGNVMGCYLHGLFATDQWRSALLARLGIEPAGIAFRQSVETALDELAEAMENHIDIDGLLAAAQPVSGPGTSQLD